MDKISSIVLYFQFVNGKIQIGENKLIKTKDATY